MQSRHQVRARIFLLVGLLLLFAAASAVAAKPVCQSLPGTQQFSWTDLNNDSKPDDYQVVETGQKTVLVVSLSDGQSFCVPLKLSSVEAIIPFDSDRDGDLDLVFFDADSALTETAWNEHSRGFRTSPLQHVRFPGEHPQVASGSGVDAISLTSPPLADYEFTGAQGTATFAIPTSEVRYSLGYGASPSPLRFLIYSLTRRGPPASSSIL